MTRGFHLPLLVATTNSGKLREIRELLGDAAVDLLTLGDVPAIEAPEETGVTFEENARLKATYYSTQTGRLTVAEDSGLVVDALDGPTRCDTGSASRAHTVHTPDDEAPIEHPDDDAGRA